MYLYCCVLQKVWNIEHMKYVPVEFSCIIDMNIYLCSYNNVHLYLK